MTRDEFLHLVEDENLVPKYCGFEKEPGLTYVQDTYGWAYVDGKWCPYKTDERGSPMYFRECDTESKALESLLDTLRREKRIAKTKRRKK